MEFCPKFLFLYFEENFARNLVELISGKIHLRGSQVEILCNSPNIKSSNFFFFLREFQPMASAPDNNSLSSNQDTNQFLV